MIFKSCSLPFFHFQQKLCYGGLLNLLVRKCPPPDCEKKHQPISQVGPGGTEQGGGYVGLNRFIVNRQNKLEQSNKGKLKDHT